MQGQNPPAIPAHSRPPAAPPNPLSYSADRSSQQAIRLSTKLPDPPVFSGTNSHVPFDDWKIRIQDKLTHNSDHYPSESFKVAYLTSRLSGEASKYITLKRRQKSLSNDDFSSNELLDLLSDLYETPLSIIYKENRHALHHLKQGIKQPFPEFYANWIRCSERGYVMNEEMQVYELENRLKEELREPFASVGCHKPWTVSDSKAYLTKLDQFQRLAADDLAQEKAQAFAAQYARANAEAKANAKRSRSGQQIKILSRLDSGYESGEDPEDPAYWR